MDLSVVAQSMGAQAFLAADIHAWLAHAGQSLASFDLSSLLQGVQGAPQAVPVAPVEGVPAGAQTTAHDGGDYTLWGLFLRADWIVKSVMLGLLIASFWSWAIIVDKYLRFSRLSAKADRFEQAFWSGKSLDDLYNGVGVKPDHPMAVVFAAAMREWRRAFEGGAAVNPALAPSIKERIDRVMNLAISREMTGVESYLPFLATVGSAAPFIGLFGTVWGIMNSFRAIAVSHETNLAVVAPGIAEALFATALGLLAAIPAVMAYNKFVTDAGRYAGRLEGFADEFSAILSRQLDERAR